MLPSFFYMRSAWALLVAAWMLATVSTAGALFMGEVMGMTPCNLCWFQRIAMFPLVLILGMSAYRNDREGALYALPLAGLGTLTSLYHTLLIAGWVPKAWVPCGAGASCANQALTMFYGVQIPWLSLAAFVSIAALLCIYLKKTSP